MQKTIYKSVVLEQQEFDTLFLLWAELADLRKANQVPAQEQVWVDFLLQYTKPILMR
jgi:hypothetical protein